MKTYNLLYNKEANLEIILDTLSSANVHINEVFSSIGIINVSGEYENFSEIEGIIAIDEDHSIDPIPAYEWHLLRVVSKTLPMKDLFIPRNTGTDVDIYLIDSGIDSTHPEFEEANIVNLYSFNETFDDETGHGTGVASVIVGKTLGISTEANLKLVKIPMGQSIPLSSLLEAFNAIAADKEGDNFAVINCSWTIPKSMILDNLVSDLRSQGFLVVAAAGNTISSTDDLSPVGYDAVLGVGCTDAFDRVISWAQDRGSNFGKEVDVFAPGIDVMIANKGGGFSESSGTSISAGIVSGIAAQVIFDASDIIHTSVDTTLEDIQQFIINNASENILFRNETVYGDTPNRLVMALFLTKYYNNKIPSIIKIASGETYTLPFEINEKYVTRINIGNIDVLNKTRHHPEWITLDESTNIIKFNPTDAVVPGRYKLYIEFLGHGGERLMIYDVPFTIGDPPEDKENEIYIWVIDDDDNIIVRAALGCEGGYCGGGYYDGGPGYDCLNRIPEGKGETCVCSYYGTFGECYTSLY
jgi:hypothetical protein